MGTAADACPEGSGPRLVAGRFRIEGQLGRGGMGAVYAVHDERTGRKLALKEQLLETRDEAKRDLLIAQFEREYHSLADLAHPRIIEVYDYGLDAGTPYYTMELLDGEDLHRRGSQPWPEACRLLLDVASSLAILHSRRLLHRDPSPRNVRCTANGRAKLIDFGAMTTMGVHSAIVGTPMFVPPEALQRQALDARADLYALGVLAYWLLTGRYPYFARKVSGLRDAWRSPLLGVNELCPDVPDQLERLVMQLLSLDRVSRPQTAAEVMERLASVAGLPLSEHADVTQAYLVMPPLIGRDDIVSKVREALVDSRSRRGCDLVVTGAPGAGRSRVLDACVREAKLLGMHVLRVDAADAGSAQHGLVRALWRELTHSLPEALAELGRSRRALLEHALGQRTGGPQGLASPQQRLRVQVALVDCLLSSSRTRPTLIAIDDADAADEPSLAALAALSYRPRRRNLSLMLTWTSGAPNAPALELISEVASAFEVAALDARQTDLLVRGVFGDVDHAAALAARIFELSTGNPRSAMALCEHLVERGIARYEAGAWRLPAEIAACQLPESLSSAWAARIDSLPPDARELADLIALAEPGALSIDRYPALTVHGDAARTYRALDALVSQGLVRATDLRPQLVPRAIASTLAARMDPERAAVLHGRLADAAVELGGPVVRANHLLRGGRIEEGVALAVALVGDHSGLLDVELLHVLELAYQAAQRLQQPQAIMLRLLVALAGLASLLGDAARFKRYGLPLLERLQRDSGLADFHALDDATPAAERLGQALGQAQARYEATPEAERGFELAESIAQLARLCSAAVNIGLLSQDLELLDRMPSLEPFVPVSPAPGVVSLLVELARDFQAGRLEASIGACERLLERIARPDRAGLDPIHHREMRFGVLYLRGIFEAGSGVPTAVKWVRELETEPEHRVSAWRVHLTAELMRGNVEAAHSCQRRAELLNLQDGGRLRYRGTTARIELMAHAASGDLVGIKRAMERIEALCEVYPGWTPTLDLARGYYRGYQGDLDAALRAVRRGLRRVDTGRHMDWGFLTVAEVKILDELGRHEEAVERGLAYFELHDEERLSTCAYLAAVLADAYRGSGRVEEALAWSERSIARYVESGCCGLGLGNAYETRARIAATRGELADFEKYARLCASEYRAGQNPTLTLRYKHLLQFARQAALTPSADLEGAAEWTATGTTEYSELEGSVLQQLRSQRDPARRARHGLRLILEATDASAGYLYAAQAGRLELLAVDGAEAPSEALSRSMARFLDEMLEPGSVATVVDRGSVAPPPPDSESFVDVFGRRFQPLLLVGSRGGERFVVGVASVHREPGQRERVDHELLGAIASALLERDDIDPLTWLG